MRFEFALVPVAIVATAPAVASDFLTVSQAQALIFPGATFTPKDFTLTEEQIDTLEHLSGAVVWHPLVKVWRVSTGGWFFLDQVPGREDRITYAIGLNDNGAVKGIEILVCREGYCGLGTAAWRAQFLGKTASNTADLATESHLISGSTLSTQHVTEGIRRVLATYALLIARNGNLSATNK